MLVDNNEFMERLKELFETRKAQGSVWLTCKRDFRDTMEVDNEISTSSGPQQYPCLLRASGGSKKTKFSTKVLPGNLFKFHALYGTLLKASFGSLRKRDKKRERQKAEEAKQRKERMAKDIVLSGSKRGSGRRKRQRQQKAIRKQAQGRETAARREKERSRQLQNAEMNQS